MCLLYKEETSCLAPMYLGGSYMVIFVQNFLQPKFGMEKRGSVLFHAKRIFFLMKFFSYFSSSFFFLITCAKTTIVAEDGEMRTFYFLNLDKQTFELCKKKSPTLSSSFSSHHLSSIASNIQISPKSHRDYLLNFK